MKSLTTTNSRKLIHFFAALLMLTALLTSPVGSSIAAAPTPSDVAVIVHPKVGVDNLSLADLRKVLMGERQFWTSNMRVTLLIRAPVARERDVVLKKIYQMTEAQFRKYWAEKILQGTTAGPRFVYSNQTATELVSKLEGCIAFVDASQVPKGVKTLKIDGKLPGDKGYVLQ